MPAHLGAFVAVSLVLIVVPGPDMALVTRNVLVGGRRGGVATGLGVTVGLLTWTVAASIGLAALLRASEPAFVALKVAGAAYLLWLGARSLLEAVRRRPGGAAVLAVRPPARPAVALRQGLVCNLGNPKIAVFFTSFLPQFTPAHEASFGTLLVLGATFSALGLAWLSVYGLLVARAGDVLRRGRARRITDAVTGTVLVAFGLRVAAEHR